MSDPDAAARPSDQGLAPTEPAPPAAGRIAVFVFSFVLLLGAFALFALGVDRGNGVLFSAGIVAAGVAFAVPMHRPGV